jgi:hypothetical protein
MADDKKVVEPVKLHAAVKPFDHKPEKRGSDGKIISADYYGTHIVNGTPYMYFYRAPHEFYNSNGTPIPFDQVPEVCKKQLKNKVVVPKPNESVILKKSSSESGSDGSLI